MWKLLNSLLPFDNILKYMTFNLASKCCFCMSEEDSIDHFFNSCAFAIKVWKVIHQFLGIAEKNFASIWERLSFYFTHSGISLLHSTLLRLTPSITCWFLWKMRNNWLYDNERPNTAAVLKLIKEYIFNLFSAKPLYISSNIDVEIANHSFLPIFKKPPKPVITKISWCKPISGYKFNVDASWCKDSNKVGIGLIVRNSKGKLISAEGHFTYAYSPLEAEVKAIQFGLQHACLYSDSIIIESDCLNAISSVLNPFTAHWKLFRLADEIHGMINRSVIQHCFREANKAADALAKYILASKSSSSFQFMTLPNPIPGILKLDEDNIPSLRISSNRCY